MKYFDTFYLDLEKDIVIDFILIKIIITIF